MMIVGAWHTTPGTDSSANNNIIHYGGEKETGNRRPESGGRSPVGAERRSAYWRKAGNGIHYDAGSDG